MSSTREWRWIASAMLGGISFAGKHSIRSKRRLDLEQVSILSSLAIVDSEAIKSTIADKCRQLVECKARKKSAYSSMQARSRSRTNSRVWNTLQLHSEHYVRFDHGLFSGSERMSNSSKNPDLLVSRSGVPNMGSVVSGTSSAASTGLVGERGPSLDRPCNSWYTCIPPNQLRS